MRKLLLAALVALFMVSCGGGADKVVVIKTSMGDMTVILFDETPMHKENFIELAESGQYDSTIFHRVMQNFMIQGGDVFRKSGAIETAADRIPAEIVKGFYHHTGALAAARQPDPVNPEKLSSSCQFYIVDGIKYSEADWATYKSQANEAKKNQEFNTAIRKPENGHFLKALQQYQQEMNKPAFDSVLALVMNNVEQMMEPVRFTKEQDEIYTTIGGAPHLDNEYTVFGKVVEGLEVIDKIAAVQTQTIAPQMQNVPVDPVYLSMEVKTMSKSEISSKYGYEYPSK